MKIAALVTLLVATGSLCACNGAPEKKDEATKDVAWETYKPTGSNIRERSDGRRSPQNSSSAPVRDVQNVPAVTIERNQAPK